MCRLQHILFGLGALFATGNVWAQSFPISTTITPANPSMPVVFISTPNCTGQGVTPVHYFLQPFYVRTGGTYQVTMTDTLSIASVYIHSATFNPITPFPTCVAASNTRPIMFSVTLTPNVQYFAVPFNDSFDQTQTPTITLDITGPGTVLLGSPTVEPVPVMSGWALLALLAAVMLAAARFMRRRVAG
jgi:hypothetical protein